ncbi:MAG: KH domain-containing protein [Thermoleophilia bacterium]|nr:KH domain-containing protein [Thermoleophilia bacterium]
MADMVATLARGLVDTPDEVRVEREREGDTTVLSLYVAQEDLGQVIGRGGRIARSLRLVTRQAAHAGGGRVNLEIVD